MESAIFSKKTTVKNALCPYCGEQTRLKLPHNYEPIYAYCNICGKKFITERLTEGFQTWTLEDAPCWSDPDWRQIEMGAGDEE
ncbi:MAG TPA: hypothetical protein ACFCUC_09515 [Desulfobacterales bacterium]